nr:hypothetical protein [Maliibacterium massiliense]
MAKKSVQKTVIQDPYEMATHRVGRVWCILALLVMFMVPAGISLRYNLWPPIGALASGLLSVVAVYLPIAIVEFMTYAPMLGSGASYLVFVTGNLTNLKIPCASMAMDIAKAGPGTPEGEIVSTLAISASSIVTTVIIALGVMLIVPLQPILNSPVLKPAFDNVLPALFGALGYQIISKNPKLAIVPVILMVIIFQIAPSANIGVLIPISVLATIGASRILYKKGWVKDAKL